MSTGTTPTKPADVVRELLARFERQDMAGFVNLFHQDAKVEIPFAAPGSTSEINGRDELWAHIRNYTERLDVRKVPDILIHETTDPEVVIVEWKAHGITVTTGRPYDMRYIIVIQVREGEIVGYRDYFSPVQAAKAGNSRPEIQALYPDDDAS